jgi:L-seryl-tRNA(Ser) seleniumtransferase
MEVPFEEKDSSPSDDQKRERLRSIPSIEKILSTPEAALAEARFGRSELKREISSFLTELRAAEGPVPAIAGIIETVESRLAVGGRSLRRVINGTGIIIHTNLGRSPIAPEVLSGAAALLEGYSNLEFDLERGARGSRAGHLEELCRRLFGAEAALLTNNNAAGTLLVMAALAPGREVIVSRGELVEIGGSFRIPDVIQQGGARLREVGTTNRTRAADYEAAISPSSGAILAVHRSNFEIVGFTESAGIGELVGLARRSGLPLVFDEGSGRVVDLAPYGLSRKQTVAELLELGVDVVTCSTDKLIGSVQGGLILGRADLLQRCAKHPLMRALRAGKESYALIAATLQSFLRQNHEEEIPVYRMLSMPLDALKRRAGMLIDGGRGEIVELRGALGGGTTPTETIASCGIALHGDAGAWQRALLDHEVPIVGRIENGRCLLDLRTIAPAEDQMVLQAIRNHQVSG